jgi:hypothetical protein
VPPRTVEIYWQKIEDALEGTIGQVRVTDGRGSDPVQAHPRWMGQCWLGEPCVRPTFWKPTSRPLLRSRRGGGAVLVGFSKFSGVKRNRSAFDAFVQKSARSGGFVSDVSKRESRVACACPRCQAAMREIIRIAPIRIAPGLIGYECPTCGYVTSVKVPTGRPDRRSTPRR